MRKYFIIALVAFSIGFAVSKVTSNCSDNKYPTYNPNTGLPINCRAIIETNINAYRSGQYPVENIMSSIERNCGSNGYSW